MEANGQMSIEAKASLKMAQVRNQFQWKLKAPLQEKLSVECYKKKPNTDTCKSGVSKLKGRGK